MNGSQGAGLDAILYVSQEKGRDLHSASRSQRCLLAGLSDQRASRGARSAPGLPQNPARAALQRLRGPVRRHRNADDAADRETTVGQEPEDVQLLLHVPGSITAAPRSNARCSSPTSVGQRRWPRACRQRRTAQSLDRFYSVASKVVFDLDGAVDKFVGDELVAFFYPLLTGERHAGLGVECARAPMVATGHQEPEGPWLPVGAGVHTGLVWMGAIGEGTHVELTAVGDAVNTTARLASTATAGEVLVTVVAAEAAGLDPSLERKAPAAQGKAGHDRSGQPQDRRRCRSGLTSARMRR